MVDLKEQFDFFCKEKNVIDLTRGKPSPEQLNLSEELDGILDGNFIQDGIDIRNYGEIKVYLLQESLVLSYWIILKNLSLLPQIVA